jgi:hypothetical protein
MVKLILMETSLPPGPLPEPPAPSPEDSRRQRGTMIGIAFGALLIVGLIGFSIWWLLQDSTPTERIRDIFIIFMALETLLLGLAVVILIIQISRLINLLNNEIKPILESTNETISTLRGTTEFLSNNAVEPIIRMNEYFAGLQELLKLLGLARSKRN